MLAAIAGCSSSPTRAPVEDRGQTAGAAPAPTVNQVDPRSLPGYENMGKPGYYTVQRGDTVRKIALDHGQNWRDVIRWNAHVVPDPNAIEVGQVLRVSPPPGAAPSAPVVAAAPAPAPSVSELPAAGSASPAPAPTQPRATGGEEVAFIWPASGSIIAGYDEAKNKGIDIAGKAGDPVVAAADGKVVYAGSGLRGYGQLIILKHNNTYLTAYAHNRALLVKEDQSVTKGQKIAEMGNTDADRVKLHFEVRRQGKPTDPSRYLPAR
ncbi:peptidase [Comamonas serinivorans]|uniref:Peptidase n=2 Tax=Comamonas serinivorans TaxID=1082851 RepID=A0A1Y0ETL1_9BURK|nr:peptidase [Comamonas serinivorans]